MYDHSIKLLRDDISNVCFIFLKRIEKLFVKKVYHLFATKWWNDRRFKKYKDHYLIAESPLFPKSVTKRRKKLRFEERKRKRKAGREERVAPQNIFRCEASLVSGANFICIQLKCNFAKYFQYSRDRDLAR